MNQELKAPQGGVVSELTGRVETMTSEQVRAQVSAPSSTLDSESQELGRIR